jgi:hypothetical protein
MMLTQEQIKQINKECPYSLFDECQGIFIEPNGIPNNIKEPVIYFKWSPGGAMGGSCYADSELEEYDNIKPDFIVLDKILALFLNNLKLQTMSIVRNNLLTLPWYAPYCGNDIARYTPGGCDNPRTVWSITKEQFVCPKCGYTTEFPKDFLEEYKKYRETWKHTKQPLSSLI